MQVKNNNSNAAGFSLLELIIAVSIALVAMLIGTTLLAGGFNVRSRENTRADAISDAQKAINIMSRDIGNSGFGLTTNGVVGADSGQTSIRVRANLNSYTGPGFNDRTLDPDEDVRYYLYTSGTTKVIARYDINSESLTPLANQIDSLKIQYYGGKIDYNSANCDITTTAAQVLPAYASYIVLTACVQLPQVGKPGSPGYQPATTVQLTSDVTLRNFSQTKLNEY